MEEITVTNWNDFDKYISELEEFRSTRMAENENSAISNWVYRGQADSTWDLSSTLDRSGWKTKKVLAYYQLAYRSRSHIESLANIAWDVPELASVQEKLEKNGLGLKPGLPAYEYLVYLRHHGFPSPLLDWSISPYVALLFAFMDRSAADFVSIYAFMEYSTGAKISDSSHARIEQYGPYVRAHKRHAMQQSVYTICYGGHGSNLYFDDYASATNHQYKDQDILRKINIPSSLRIEFLRRMDRFNLNPFSLFGSEESLVRTISLREMFF